MFFTFFGYWVGVGWGGGSPKGLVYNLLVQLFGMSSPTIKVSETFFSHIVIT